MRMWFGCSAELWSMNVTMVTKVTMGGGRWSLSRAHVVDRSSSPYHDIEQRITTTTDHQRYTGYLTPYSRRRLWSWCSEREEEGLINHNHLTDRQTSICISSNAESTTRRYHNRCLGRLARSEIFTTERAAAGTGPNVLKK